MDIYALLKKDHRTVSELFEKLENARSDSSRESILNTIRDELLLHAKTEEATFYAALEKASETHLKELMPEAEEEHDGVRAFFTKIDSAKVGTPKWYMLIGSLKQAVEHHVEEEEGMIFKHAKEVLNDDQAKQLAAEMKELKEQETPDQERLHNAPEKAA